MSSAALRSATVTAAVVVLAKEPVPGRVKTRLQTRFSPAESAALARAAIGDTFDAVATAFRGRTFAAWDGTGRDDVPADVPVVPQSAGSLDHRIEAALADAMRSTRGPSSWWEWTRHSSTRPTSTSTGARQIPYWG